MRRSKTEMICAMMSTAYTVYLMVYFMWIAEGGLSGSIAAAIVTPHMLFCLIGAIFGWVAYFTCNQWMALASVVLLCVAAVVFLMYAKYLIFIIFIGFMGFLNIRIENDEKNKNSNE